MPLFRLPIAYSWSSAADQAPCSHRIKSMKISIQVDKDFDSITANCIGKDSWEMIGYIKGIDTIFDHYFTADVFDLIREEISPIA